MATKTTSRAAQKRSLTQQTLNAINGLFRKAPKVGVNAVPATHSQPAPAKKTVVHDLVGETQLLEKILTQEAGDERDIRLSNFASQTVHADLRWQAAQAVIGETGWLMLQKNTAPRDRRVAKYVKEHLSVLKAVQQRATAWRDLAAGYASLLQSPAIDIRHFMELDKAFDTAHAQHRFDEEITAQVAQWRGTLQARMQQQNETQRQAQAVASQLKSVLAAAQKGVYSAQLQAQLDDALAQQPNLPPANGVFAIQRLHTEINALIHEVPPALARAAQSASRLEAVQALVAKAQAFAAQSPSKISASGVQALKKEWHSSFAAYAAEKVAFDAAMTQAGLQLEAQQARLATRHEQGMQWLQDLQSQLQTALDEGQGQRAVQLAGELFDAAGHRYDPARLSAEQSSAIERLLAQARETRGLLHETAALEREALIAKAQALAAKPLLGKYQEQAVKELSDAWKALQQKFGAASHAVYVQFKTACDEAYAPVKEHKDAMRQVMAQGSAQRQAQIDELSGLLARVDWANADWAAVEQLRQEARNAWRQSLPTDYKSREKLGQAHDGIMALLDEKLAQARDVELTRRSALTQAAVALASKPFAEQHAGVRDLMARYNAERSGVYLPRGLDQAAWAEFKAAIDAVYSRRDQERQSQAAQSEQALGALIALKQSVLAQLQADTANFASQAKRLSAALSQAQAAWDEPGRLPRGVGMHGGVSIDALVQQWLAAQDAAKQALSQAANLAQTAQLHSAWQAAQLLDAGQALDEVVSLIEGDGVLKKASATRMQGQSKPTALPISLLEAILDAEIASNTASPETYKSARLQRQVHNLSAKLSGNLSRSATAGLDAWLAAVAVSGSTQGEAATRLSAVMHSLGAKPSAVNDTRSAVATA